MGMLIASKLARSVMEDVLTSLIADGVPRGDAERPLCFERSFGVMSPTSDGSLRLGSTLRVFSSQVIKWSDRVFLMYIILP